MNPLENTETAKQTALARGQRLKHVRELLGLTLHEFSERFEVGVSTVSHWEHARANGLSPKGASKVAQRAAELGLRVGRSWLLYGTGEAPRLEEASVTLSGEAAGNMAGVSMGEQLADYYLHHQSGAMVFTVNDLVHAPLLEPGDKVLGFEVNLSEFVPKSTDLYIVTAADGRVLLRYVERLDANHLAILSNKPKSEQANRFQETLVVTKLVKVEVMLKG